MGRRGCPREWVRLNLAVRVTYLLTYCGEGEHWLYKDGRRHKIYYKGARRPVCSELSRTSATVRVFYHRCCFDPPPPHACPILFNTPPLTTESPTTHTTDQHHVPIDPRAAELMPIHAARLARTRSVTQKFRSVLFNTPWDGCSERRSRSTPNAHKAAQAPALLAEAARGPRGHSLAGDAQAGHGGAWPPPADAERAAARSGCG